METANSEELCGRWLPREGAQEGVGIAGACSAPGWGLTLETPLKRACPGGRIVSPRSRVSFPPCGGDASRALAPARLRAVPPRGARSLGAQSGTTFLFVVPR